MTQRDKVEKIEHRQVSIGQVRGWFREIEYSHRIAIPSDEALADATKRLNAYSPPSISPRPVWKSTSAARAFAKAIKADTAVMMEAISQLPERERTELVKIRDSTVAAVAAFQRAFEIPDLTTTWHDSALFIDYVAAVAWAQDGEAPQSAADAGPRVAFACNVLAHWGLEKNTDVVSKALQGRGAKMGAAFRRLGDRVRGGDPDTYFRN